MVSVSLPDAPARDAGRQAFPSLRPGGLLRGLAVFLGLVYLAVGVGVAHQARAAGSLRGDIALLRDTLAQASLDRQGMERRLREAQERRAIAVALTPDRLGASQVMDRVLEQARQAQVEVLDARARPPEREKVGDRAYEVHRYELAVRGEVQRLLAFLGYLDTDTMDSLVVRSASLISSRGAPSLAVAFAVYTQPGAAEAASGGGAPPVLLPQTAGQERARLRAVVERLWGRGGWELVIGLLSALREPDSPSGAVDSLLYQAYVTHGRELVAQGHAEQGIEQFRAALALRPEGPEAQDGLRVAEEALHGR